jgi:hypothetical protein
MRPKSIIHAERVFLAAAALLVLGTALIWTPMVEAYGVGMAIGTTAFLVGLYLLLILFTTRRGSRIARGLLVGLVALSLAAQLWQIANGEVALGAIGVINTVQVLLTVVGAVLLFRPNAASWFARPHDTWEEDK